MKAADIVPVLRPLVAQSGVDLADVLVEPVHGKALPLDRGYAVVDMQGYKPRSRNDTSNPRPMEARVLVAWQGDARLERAELFVNLLQTQRFHVEESQAGITIESDGQVVKAKAKYDPDIVHEVSVLVLTVRYWSDGIDVPDFDPSTFKGPTVRYDSC